MAENSTYIDNTAQETPNGDNLNAENTAADAAEAEKDKAATACGKFKSVEALEKAYLSLEAEFTRRSQRLRELEEKKADQPLSPAVLSEEQLIDAALKSDKVKRTVIGEYLKSVFAGKSVPLTVEGSPCAAPRKASVSIKEAGRVAELFLKN